jgi:thiamine-phosphate pyrophosphorylase
LPRVEFGLYLITDRHQCGDGDLVDRVEQALHGGVRAVQLREKDSSTRERFELGKKLRQVTSAADALLLVNGDAALARAIGADGVHLPADGLPVDVCRKVLAPGMIVGVSTHSLAEARDAEIAGADFITYGPVYYTESKAKYGAPVGVGALCEVCAGGRLPVFALGGIKRSNINEVIAAGASGVAMISAVLAAEDCRSAAAGIAECVHKARAGESCREKEG